MTIYLDNAASSCPKPEEVMGAMDRCLREFCANPGRGAHKKAVAAARMIFQARESAAAFLGISDSANLIFTQNATDALNIAMYGLLEPGDHVVTTAVEHNAVIRPLMALGSAGVEVDLVRAGSDGIVEPDEIIKALKADTKLVVMGHGSNVTGAIQPVEELARRLAENAVPLLVDAAQSAGSIPYDMEASPIAMLACTGHKSLMGPQGVGLLYIRPDIDLRSMRQGGTGTHSTEPQDLLARPDRYEAGTYNTPGIAGLGAGIDYVSHSGVEKLAAHKNGLVQALIAGLADISGVDLYGPAAGQPRFPLICFNVKQLAPAEVAGKLDRDYDVASRGGLHCAPGAHEAMGTGGRGAVRLSVGPFNIMSDIDAAIRAVTEIATGA